MTDILSENLWNNNDIKIANRPIFYKQWFDKNILFLKDLFDEQGKLMDFYNFCLKYQIHVNFVEYFGVRAAVETFIKRTGIDTETENKPLTNIYIPFHLKEILKSKKGSKDMYNIFNNKEVVIKSKEKWNQVFENINLNWKIIYSLPAKCCSNTKLHWFQYRITHRILATNDFLLKIKVRENNLCTFCGLFPEKIEHLFWYCHVVREFWETIERWVSQSGQILLNINKQLAIFGITYNIISNKAINYILILTRYYIYKCRISNKQLKYTQKKY